ncbi:MAG: hypothetical protein RIR26_1734 [Pseudomonadota bacterium]
MLHRFQAHGFLLAEHSVYESLAQELIESALSGSHQRWNVVCERKEDLVSIRTQIFSLLKNKYELAFPEEELQAWAGLSLYTPDTLVRNFALTLSHNTAKQLGDEAYRLLRSPFLDIVEQERLTRLLLLQLGYAGSDVAPLAKQILTLSDTELPPDESFFSLLMEVQKTEGTLKAVTDIPDLSLRTICVAYQLLQQINSHFCRLQSCVGEYLQPHFRQHLRATLSSDKNYQNFLFPKKFLSDPFLWIGAPEYIKESKNKSDQQQTYRPGNFQAAWIDSLRDVIFESRTIFQTHTAEIQPSKTWWAQTLISSDSAAAGEPSALIHVMGSQAALEQQIDTLAEASDAQTILLMGDINSRLWNVSRSDGSGIHALSPADFAQHWNNVANVQDDPSEPQSADPWEHPAAERVRTLHSEFNTDWQRLDAFKTVIDNALVRYELTSAVRTEGVSFEVLLHRFFDGETFQLGSMGTVGTLPQALSLLPGLSAAERFCILGVPHSATTPSFHLRILNSLFHHLRSKQVPLDPIASEQAYRGYWQSFFTRTHARVEFYVRNLKECEAFPDYAKPWCLPPLVWSSRNDTLLPRSPFERWLKTPSELLDPTWVRLTPNKPPHDTVSLAVTAFEDYVECPLQFYWMKLHRTEMESLPALQADRLQLGQRAHALAESFFRSVRHLILLEENSSLRQDLWRQIFTTVNDGFITTDDFILADAEAWGQALLKAIEASGFSEIQKKHIAALAQEMQETIFEPSPTAHREGKQLHNLKTRLTREGVRRALRKLLQSELLMLEQDPSPASTIQQAKAAFIEVPVAYNILPQLSLSGRIDRVDTHPSGDRIFDYKTSKVPRNDPALVLKPSVVNSTNRLSIQGAIYSLAWARQQSAAAESDFRGVRSFTLLRLKTLDLSRNPMLSYEFESPLTSGDTMFEEIHQEYELNARNLMTGRFSAAPLLKDHCKTCPLNELCPTPHRSGASE